ncbi:MAG: type I methionyl aminopeptidase [Actinobacteria bacterium]|nr:type I methionyl aminopeptidase [Actinomycetota bacterium]
MAIQIKTLEQLNSMRKAGLVVAHTLNMIRDRAEIGMTTIDLDLLAVRSLEKYNAKSSFKGYHGYPAVICASVNEEVVHGIPNKRALQDGDILSVDFGAIVDGWHGDAAISIGMGNVDPADQKLMDVCEESMWRGIAAGVNGAKLTDISEAVEHYINSQGKYGILREYGGHGIGSEMHQEPHILNFGKGGNGPELIPGMALAIEPMITRGSEKTKVLSDDWTVVSQDHSRGAHFEHTYAIAPDGKPFVLTAIDGGMAELNRLGIEISELL